MRRLEGLISSLREFGLTEYEARIYLALLSKGPMKVSELAAKAGVPRTKGYEAVKGLKDKGLIETFGRPLRCRPLNFETAMGKVIETEEKRLRTLKQAFTKVRNFTKEKMSRIRVVHGKFQLVYPESVVDILKEMINDSRGYFHAMVDGWGIKLLKEVSSNILGLMLAGVDVKVTHSYKDYESIMEENPPFSFKIGPIVDGKSIFISDDRALFIVDSTSGTGYHVRLPDVVSLVDSYVFRSMYEMAVDSSKYMRMSSVGMAEELPYLRGNPPLYEVFMRSVFRKLPVEQLWEIGVDMFDEMVANLSSHLFTIKDDTALSVWSELISLSINGKVRYDTVSKMMIIEWKGDENLELPTSLWLLAFYGYLKRMGREMIVISRLSEGPNHILQLKVPWPVLEGKVLNDDF